MPDETVGKRPPTPDENDAARQFLAWAFPTFDVMQDQAVSQMGLNAGCSILQFALLAYAAGLALDAKAPDKRAALNEKIEHAWKFALKKRDAENGPVGHG